MYLLDTNVVSEMRKIRIGQAASELAMWATTASPESMYLSVVTILELELGVLLKGQKDRAQGEVFQRWLHGLVIPAFAERILPVDLQVALRCAALHVPKTQPERDALIAATALVHGLTLVTRNVKDFQGAGVRLLNPWLAQP